MMDSECQIGFYKKDFASEDEPKADDDEIEDIDLENLEMEDLEQEEEAPEAVVEDAPIEEASIAVSEAALAAAEVEESNEEKENPATSSSQTSHLVSQKSLRPVKKVLTKVVEQQVDQFIDVNPQETFLSNCRFHDKLESGESTSLAWNIVGTVHLRKQNMYTSVDVDFTDKNFHSNIRINDDFKSSMASLSYGGLLLASKGEEQDLDKYEDDEEDLDAKSITDNEKVDKKSSYLFYKSLSGKKDWFYKMLPGEHVECIAQGTGWCCAYTDSGYLRFFSSDGVQKLVIHQGSMLVSMAGYENLLAIVYHSGLPIYEHQQLTVKIIDCNSRKTIYEGLCPLSRLSRLSWFGFSEEGQLSTMDDNGVISALNFKTFHWSPILDLKLRYPSTYKNFWVVGLLENELLAIEMANGVDQPPLTLKNKHKVVKLAFPLLNQEKNDVDSKEMTLAQIEEQYLREHFFLDHEQYRKELWEPLKLFRSSRDNEKVLSESIFDQKQIIQ